MNRKFPSSFSVVYLSPHTRSFADSLPSVFALLAHLGNRDLLVPGRLLPGPAGAGRTLPVLVRCATNSPNPPIISCPSNLSALLMFWWYDHHALCGCGYGNEHPRPENKMKSQHCSICTGAPSHAIIEHENFQTATATYRTDTIGPPTESPLRVSRVPIERPPNAATPHHFTLFFDVHTLHQKHTGYMGALQTLQENRLRTRWRQSVRRRSCSVISDTVKERSASKPLWTR